MWATLLALISAWVVILPTPPAEAAVAKRSRTVEFFAGQLTGSAGANQNVKNDFPAQTFKLAETNASIVDAYVEVSAQIGANAATAYGSAHVYFDACVPACTPSTAAFTTTAGLGTSTEGQFIRFRAPVTSEAEIAAYTGGGAARSFAVGYCFATGASCSGTTSVQIFGTSAKLVLTYIYDASSANETNTVVYPLESGIDVGSKTTTTAACTMDSGCPLFGYSADIPDLGAQESQWFRLHNQVDTSMSTDHVFTPQVDGNASGGTYHHEAALRDNGGWVDYFASGLPGYANNTAQQLEQGHTGNNAMALGGENVITYTRAASAATKTRTVTLPVGEVITASGTTTKSALTGPTVYLPESGVAVKKAWFRVHSSSTVGGASTLLLSTKVGGRAETAQTTYNLYGDTFPVSLDGYLNYLIPAAEYAEIAAAGASTGKAVQLAAQWGATNPGGAVNAELVITYSYTGETGGYLSTQRIFAGQQTAAPATTYTTATGALDPSLPDTGTVTIRGASLETNTKNTGTTADENIGSKLTAGSCTPAATSTVRTAVVAPRISHWNDVSAVVTNSDTATYTACYATTEASVFSGTLTVTYQATPPSVAPNSPAALTQKTSADVAIATGATSSDTVIKFGADVSDPDNPSHLQLCVEVDVVGTAFSGTEDACGTGVSYSGTAVTATVSRTLPGGRNYHWRVRTRDAGGLYSAWVSYGGNTEDAIDFAITAKRSRTVEFFAGQHTGSTGVNENAKNDFPAQSFKLAETNAKIVDAYVEVSAQIGAVTATTYNSAHIYFDACVPACTPATTAFTSTASLGTAGAITQFVRFRAPVTSEAEIVAYTGGGAARSFAVGYCFATGTACSGTTSAQVWGANAKLVLTYTYDEATANETNTVLYPLESATDVGSKPATTAVCTMDSTCPLFGYNAALPDLGTQDSQWFRLHSFTESTGSNDQVYTPQVNGNASGATFHVREALGNQGGWVEHYATGLPGYANNTAQQLEYGITAGGNAHTLGGENVITYTRSASAATKTKTVTFPVGEVITANASTAKSALTGPTVYFPETGASIQKAWFRVHGSPAVNAASTLLLSTKVGARAETAQTIHSFTGDSTTPTTDGYLTYLIPAADYAEMAAAGASTGKAVQLAAQWGSTNAGGAVSAELVVTYTYTGDTGGYLSTQRLLAGQQTAAAATTWATSTGAVDPALPDTGTITIRGAWMETNAKNTGTTALEAIGSQLSTSSCAATAASTARTGTHMTRIGHWKDHTAAVTSSEFQTYTACYATTEASVFSGTLAITYQVAGASTNTAPNSASSLSQRTAADVALAVGAWHNNGSITFRGSVSDPDASDTLALCVEVDPLGTAFSGTEDACGTGVAYSGSAVAASVGRTLAAGEYHWQVRVKDAAGAYSAWVSFGGGNAETARDVGVDLTAPVAGSAYDGTSAGVDAAFNTGSLTSLSGNWDGFSDPASGLARYDLAVGTTAGGTEVLTWTNANLDTSATPTGLSLATSVVYYVSVRAVDNAGNTTPVTSNGQQVAPVLGFTATALASGASCGDVTTNIAATAASLTFRPVSLSQLIAGVNLTVTTNAAAGYTVTAAYTGPATGAHTNRAYLDVSGTNATPVTWPASGTEAFGYTTSSVTLSGTANRFTGPKWAAFTTAGAEILRGTTPTTSGTTNCLAISLSKAGDTPADTYTTTLRYTATPNF